MNYSTVLWREATEWPNPPMPPMTCESHFHRDIFLPFQQLLKRNTLISLFHVAHVAVMRLWRNAGMKSMRKGPSSHFWSTAWGICWQTAIKRYIITLPSSWMRYWQAFKYFTLVQFHSNFTLTLKLNCKKFVKKQKQIVLQFYGYIFMLLLQPNSDGNLVFFKFFFSHLMTLAIIVTFFLFFKIKQFHTKP